MEMLIRFSVDAPEKLVEQVGIKIKLMRSKKKATSGDYDNLLCTVMDQFDCDNDNDDDDDYDFDDDS